MAIGMMSGFVYCRFSQFTQQFLRNRWLIRSFTHRGKQFHNSPVLHSVSDVGKLIDQGRRSVLKLKSRDKVPKDYQLIYKASMELTLRVAYPTFMTCTVGLLGLLIYRKYDKENLVVPKSAGRDGAIKFNYPEQELWVFSAGLLLLAIAGLSIMFKYPFRVYKHNIKKEYIAIYLNPIPLMLKQVQFKSVTPTKFKNPFYFFTKDCHYVLDNTKKSFLMSQFFRVPRDLTDMYEEPEKCR